MATPIPDAPGDGPHPAVIRLGRAICGDLAAATRREFLLTDGLGGYAMGTIAGPATRRYHGWLIAALRPPVDRTVLVGGMREWLVVDGRRIALHTVERSPGRFDGDGIRFLEAFEADGITAAWTFAVGDVRIVRRAWMAHGAPVTYVRWEAVGRPRSIRLEVTPLVTARDHHLLTGREVGAPTIRPVEHPGWSVGVDVGFPGAGGLRVLADGGGLNGSAGRGGTPREPAPSWARLHHREEAARGQDHRSELFTSPTLVAPLTLDRPVTLAFASLSPASWGMEATGGSPSVDGLVTPSRVATPPVPAPERALQARRGRAAELIRRAGSAGLPVEEPLARTLAVAADAFLVDRAIPRAPARPGAARAADDPLASTRATSTTPGRTIIAGYPWFNDWGRDTMIALPGLTLVTGRVEEAASILRAFGRFVRGGLLPNAFPDHADDEVAYHTIDASLWYPNAIEAYRRRTGDEALVDELLPVVRGIIDAHVAGTRFGIGMDPADGLIRGGAEGYQLTWMDARLDDWVVTPRRGKPVEIQALWVDALRTVAAWLGARADHRGAASLEALADRATEAFLARFWRPDVGYLADVVDGPDGDDPSLRPNQVFALALPHPVLDPAGRPARAVLDAVGRSLVTTYGLRSLAPDDPAYRGRHRGDRRARDGAYHQGTVWAWLIGPYLDAVLAVTGDRDAVRHALEPFEDQVADAAIGSISETFDGDPPHDPTGCIAQAWSVSEVLRLLHRVGPAEAASPPVSREGA